MSLVSTTVADIAAPDSRSIAIGPFGSALRAELYTEHGVPVVRGQDITDLAEVELSDPVFVSPETAARFPACLLSEGDLVFPHRGAIGRVGLIGRTQMLLSSSMMKLTCDRSKVDPLFLLHYFRGPGKRELLMRASTVGTPGIGQPLTSLRGIPLDLPPLSEQRAIAEVLGALDDKIAANRQVDAIAEDLLASAFDRLAGRATREGRLNDLAQINAKRVTPQLGGELRYLDIASVGNGSYEPPSASPWDEAPGRARRGLVAGDVVWSTVRPNRRSHALVLDDDKRLVASTGLAVLTPREVSSAYLYQTTKTPQFQQYLETVAEGSAYPAVKADRFADAPVSILGDDDRAAFDQIAVPMRDAQHAHLVENEKLAKTRDGLLPLLMSGKLRVKDAEKRVEDVV